MNQNNTQTKAPPGAVDGQAQQFVLQALDRYERPLTRYAQRMFGSVDTDSLEAARDAVQHTFLKLCQQPREKIASKLAPWLYSVCRNRVIDQIRDSGKVTGKWPPPMVDSQFSSDDSADPAKMAERAELSQRLTVLIGKLSGSEREIIELWSQGLKHKEIAEVLDKSPPSVRVGLHRALKRLKSHPEVQSWLERATSKPESRFHSGLNSQFESEKHRSNAGNVDGKANVAIPKTQSALNRGTQS